MVTKYDFELVQGATFSKTLTYKDSSGDPVDLTGYTGRLQIRTTKDAASAELELTTENGGMTLGGTAGTIALLVSAATTGSASYTGGVYDLELVNGSTVTRLLEGNFPLNKEVTR